MESDKNGEDGFFEENISQKYIELYCKHHERFSAKLLKGVLKNTVKYRYVSAIIWELLYRNIERCSQKGIRKKATQKKPPEKCHPEKCHPGKKSPEKCQPEVCDPGKKSPRKKHPEKSHLEKSHPSNFLFDFPEVCSR